jgi:hypothetical protein
MRNHPALISAGLFVLVSAGSAIAGPSEDCAAADGTYLTGSVTSDPRFASGHRLKGVELSHTLLSLKADQDGRTYQVAIDNVFAAGYDAAAPQHQVPAPLDTISTGDRIEVCGATYSNPLGIHWVHTDCGDTPTKSSPNGWLRTLGPNGQRSDNLEGSTEYCSLWAHGRASSRPR